MLLNGGELFIESGKDFSLYDFWRYMYSSIYDNTNDVSTIHGESPCVTFFYIYRKLCYSVMEEPLIVCIICLSQLTLIWLEIKTILSQIVKVSQIGFILCKHNLVKFLSAIRLRSLENVPKRRCGYF